MIHRYADANALQVQVDGRLLKLSDDSLVVAPHSGHESQIIVADGRAWAVWPERSRTDSQVDAGTPCFAAEIDRRSWRVDRYYLGLADPTTPGPDNHCQPQILLGPDKHLHLVLGAHHGPLLYARSYAPLTLRRGWSAWREIGAKPGEPHWGYSYPSLAWIGNDLHVVARWTGDRYKHNLVHFIVGREAEQSIVYSPPTPHKYAIQYHHLRADGERLIVDLWPHVAVDRVDNIQPETPDRIERELLT